MTPQPFQWEQRRQVLSIADHRSAWMDSHAQNPSPILCTGGLRVFFNTRPKADGAPTVSHPAYVDLSADGHVVGVSSGPVLPLGKRGCFDEHGCMSSCILEHDGALWMYYVGWMRCVSVPYNWAIGLAVSNDGGETFTRMFQGPVIGASHNEPYLQNGCHVVKTGGRFHMWYSTGQAWLLCDGKPESRYRIAHAESDDGLYWRRDGQYLIPALMDDETQTTPSVFFRNGFWHMFFCFRGSVNFRGAQRGYRIGYAYSRDMMAWTRDDALGGLAVSADGWDSEMVCYPRIFEYASGELGMLYCGNYFGKDGFGLCRAR